MTEYRSLLNYKMLFWYFSQYIIVEFSDKRFLHQLDKFHSIFLLWIELVTYTHVEIGCLCIVCTAYILNKLIGRQEE
jgi:hypothetical protein